jgi:transposase
MAKCRELTVEQRSRIKALYDAGWSYRKIAGDLKCSLSTINYTLKKIKTTKSCENRPRTGRKRKLSKRDVHALKLLSLRDRKKSSKQLCDEINQGLPQGTTIAASTTRRYLREQGLLGRVAVKKPLLRPQNRIKRLRFAKQHKDWVKDDWNKVLWTDESKFQLFGTNRRVYVRRRKGERLIDDCISSTVKHGGGNIMVWGSISGTGLGGLVKIDGIMDKKVYHNILVRHAVPSGLRLIGNNFVFQEDNDPKHSSNYCRNYLRRKEAAGVLTMMNWPAQSPDLNPIEQIWELVDRKLDKSRVKTKETLWLELKRCWESIPVEVVKKYIDTMPERCRAVIKAKGGHTKY